MPSNTPWRTKPQAHPGSSEKDIQDEPDWTTTHDHRIGYRNRQNRLPGLTHESDDSPDLTDSGSEPSSAFGDEANKLYDLKAKEDFLDLKHRVEEGDLVNFRDIYEHEKDIHLRQPQNKSLGWRYVLETTEKWVKEDEKWPANLKKEQQQREKQQDQKQSKRSDRDDNAEARPDGSSNEENDWKRKSGENSKHNEAYSTSNKEGPPSGSDESQDQNENEDENEKLSERYTPQEIALLKALQHEQQYRGQLKQNDGKRKSPQIQNRTSISIDEQDQFTPDNWLPRSDHLVRRTGKHPLNAEAQLTHLFEGGLITPNELHYVRNHGPVPRLLYEFHTLDVEHSKLVLGMDDLKHKFESVNIPVSLACDGNRRKELNLIKRSKGFDWGPGATGCAYWKGPLLCHVLQAAGIKAPKETGQTTKKWVNFRGADELSEGRYETCIPLEYAMNPVNDVLLAYEMNDLPLPPDHGHPLRVIIPGYVGGRCVKWLSHIWISDDENSSHYHIWDNRVLPSFISEKDGAFAQTMFSHPSTACNEQNLNSVIVKPAHGEEIPLASARNDKTYRIEGFAYDGGGHEVQRVEVSLDDGETWLYSIRKFPEYPIRHSNRFWTWIHWHVDVSLVHFLQAKSIAVRAWNVFKNTQPEKPNWNTMGMMNNCWYVVKPELTPGGDDGVPKVLYRHPVEPGNGDGGWMTPSIENQLATVKQQAGAPEKEFTRQEIEKHAKEDDCWLVVDNKVYDATSVLDWHPGGKAALLNHAGKVHQDTTDEFASVHDDFAYEKLKQCALGVVTEKAAKFIRAGAEAAAREKAQSAQSGKDVVLQKHRWVPVTLKERENVSEDTRRYTFSLPDEKKLLDLGTCQHIQIGFHMKDKMLIRSYTPTRPLLPYCPKPEHSSKAGKLSPSEELRDGQGIFELVVKTYFPDSNQPGGAMSNILDCMPIGGQVEIRGPTGEIVYNGNGKFIISDEKRNFKKLNLVLGGSGFTPGYALIARALLSKEDHVEIRVINANKSERDILMHNELDRLEDESKGRLVVTHVLSHPSNDWNGLKGHVNADILRGKLFPPGDEVGCFLCGPPAMIQKAALPALNDWGFEEDQNMFGF